MHIHYLQHVPFEGLGSMQSFFQAKGHRITASRLYAGDKLPESDELDWLVVMGGPMGVHDEPLYPWLSQEKTLIEDTIKAGKLVLGVCLGAQLIADAMGADVYKNRHREIGWFEINKNEEADGTILGPVLPDTLEAYHWHGDTFDIPRGASILASTEICPNQGFIFENRVVGFQFHLEITPVGARALIEKCSDELDGSLYVQTASEMLYDKEKFDRINAVMDNVLTALEKYNS